MKRIIGILLFIFMPLNISAAPVEPSDAKPLIVEAPIFSQKVRFTLPNGWKHANSSRGKDMFLIEFIHKHEELSNWEDLFSIQGYMGFDAKITPLQVSDNYAQEFAKKCPLSVVYSEIEERLIDGNEAYLSLIGCAQMPDDSASGLKKGMSETSIYMFIRGEKDFYVIQKTVRGDGFDAKILPEFAIKSIDDITLFFPLEFCKLESLKGQCLR